MEEKNLEISSEQLNEIRQFTGESQISIARIPFLHFNGKPGNGKFGIISGKGKEKTEEILGDSIQAVIIKVRYQFQSSMNVKVEMYSNEVDNSNCNVEIFQSGQRERVDCLSYKEVKNKYPELRSNMILYIFFQDKIWKLRVSGTGFSNFFDYSKQFVNDTFLKYYTIFSSEKAVNDAGLEYQKMTFAKGELYSDWQGIWATLKQLSENLQSTAQKRVSDGMIEAPKDDLPEIQVEDIDMEIKESDIPF